MGEYEEQAACAFKPIHENPIILDFTGCKYLGVVHQILKEKFGLPDYYGKNWDALWDCLDYRFREEQKVEIRGYGTMPRDLQQECLKMLEIFDDVHKDTPNVTFVVVS